jgi:hypothetical protein
MKVYIVVKMLHSKYRGFEMQGIDSVFIARDAAKAYANEKNRLAKYMRYDIKVKESK